MIGSAAKGAEAVSASTHTLEVDFIPAVRQMLGLDPTIEAPVQLPLLHLHAH